MKNYDRKAVEIVKAKDKRGGRQVFTVRLNCGHTKEVREYSFDASKAAQKVMLSQYTCWECQADDLAGVQPNPTTPAE